MPPAADKAWLLVKNPSSVFVCWTFSRSKAEAFEAASYGPMVLVRLVCCEDKNLAVEAEVRWDAKKIYMKPPVDGGTCSASVHAIRNDGVQEKLLETNSVSVPVSGPRGGICSGYSSAEFFRKAGV